MPSLCNPAVAITVQFSDCLEHHEQGIKSYICHVTSYHRLLAVRQYLKDESMLLLQERLWRLYAGA